MRRRAGTFLVEALLLMLAALLPAVSARAQSAESDPAPEPGSFEPGKVPQPAKPYVVPDVPPEFTEATEIRVHAFTMKPGVELMVDYDWFDQDDVSAGQVGSLEDQWDDRSSRVKFRGTLGEGYKVSYLLSVEYTGFETDPARSGRCPTSPSRFPLAARRPSSRSERRRRPSSTRWSRSPPTGRSRSGC